MYTPESLLRAARAIRPLLPELLGAGAPAVDEALAGLLHRADRGERVEHEIAELLAGNEPTRRQMEIALLSDPAPAAARYNPRLPGAPAPPRPPKYVCPAEGCGYAWYRHQMGAIPDCPVHRLPLTPATES